MRMATRLLAVLLSFLLVETSVQQAAATVIKISPKSSAIGIAAPIVPLVFSPGINSLGSSIEAPSLGVSSLLVLPESIPGAVNPGSVLPQTVSPERVPVGKFQVETTSVESKPIQETVRAADSKPSDYSGMKEFKSAATALKSWTGSNRKKILSPKTSSSQLRLAGDRFWDQQVRDKGAAPTAVSGGALGNPSKVLLSKPGAMVNAAAPQDPEVPVAKKAEKKKPFYRQLWFWIAASLVAGAGTGLLLNSGMAFLPPAAASVATDVGSTLVEGTAVWGDWFMKALRWMAGPLVLASVTSAIGGHENPKDLGGLFPRVMGYFLFTTIVSVGIGLGLALLIQPGSFFPPALLEQFATQAATSVGAAPSVWEVLSGVVPRSFTEAAMAFVNVNALQIVFMSLMASVATILIRMMKFSRLPKLGKALKAGASKFVSLMSGLQELVMALLSGKKIITKSGKKFFIPGLMHTAPIAVFGLLGSLAAEMGLAAFAGLGAYVGTVLLGLVALIGFYSLLIKFWGKRSPMKFLGDSANAAVTGFSTASSAATIPVSLETAIEKHKISKPVAKLMITMGSAMNMEGTALYQVIALLFLAQVFGIALTPVTTGLIIGTLLLSSLGTPGSPGAGMAILTSIAISIGIPVWGSGLLLAVDRPLDMSRTAVNVLGDQTSALIIETVDQNRKKKFIKKLGKSLSWLKDVPGYDHFELKEDGEEGERVKGRHVVLFFQRPRHLADFAGSGKMIRKVKGLPVYYKAIDESGVRRMTVELTSKEADVSPQTAP